MKTIDELLIADAPQALAIEVTSKFNLTCKMCPLTTGNTLSSTNPDDMTMVLWHDVLPLAKRYRNVILTGYGEPLLNPHFLPMLRELNQAQVNFSVTTNGTPITKSVALELASLESMNQLTVSIDSPERDSYRSIRGGDVEKALKGVKNLMATIRDPNRVTLSVVLMKHNIKDLINFPALLAEFGVRRFDLQILANYNPLCPEYQLIHNHELFAHIDEIKRRCEEVSLELKMDPAYAQRFVLERFNPQEAMRRYHATSSESKETRQCCLPCGVPFINREGRVFPCCLSSTDSTAIMGDLNHEHWDSIWNGRRYRDFRKRILDGNTTPSICQRCNLAPRGKHPLLLEQNEQVALYDNMPSIIQKLLKRIQGIPSDNMAPRRFFTAYYNKNLWHGLESKSGPGSEGFFAQQKVQFLKEIVQAYHVVSLLDLGCRDFYWMKEIAYGMKRYHGIDVVKPLIDSNIKQFASQAVTFQCLDITTEQEQKKLRDQPYDLVVCFDVFGNLLNDEIDRFLSFLFHEIDARYLLIMNRRDGQSELYLHRPKTREKRINVQAYRIFQDYRLIPVWQREALFPGDYFELYKMPSKEA